MKKAFITGITGQDGSYLAELLLDKGYEVHGLIRRASTFNTGRLEHIFERLHLHHGDLTDGSALARLLARVQPDEIYNLAAQSHVRVSFETPEYTCDVTALGIVRLLEAVRETGVRARIYQASSSEMYGGAMAPQDELTPFEPRSPYACAKVFAHQYAVNFRESYGHYIACGVLFNHESPRRGETFVTRKITRAVARIAAGRQDQLVLGNLSAKRDWGYAKEYVEAMWRMLQQKEPDDYLIATGVTCSVEDFLGYAFEAAGVEDWRRYVSFNAQYLRPTEVNELCGDAGKAFRELGWEAKTTVRELAALMVDADVRAIKETPNIQ
jgi:GDPmannose 4,6-dehydratase